MPSRIHLLSTEERAVRFRQVYIPAGTAARLRSFIIRCVLALPYRVFFLPTEERALRLGHVYIPAGTAAERRQSILWWYATFSLSHARFSIDPSYQTSKPTSLTKEER